jgi:hypothetical protein
LLYPPAEIVPLYEPADVTENSCSSPFIILFTEAIKSFVATESTMFKIEDFDDKNMFERTFEKTMEEWLGPFYGERNGFTEELFSGLGIITPFGKGPYIELIEYGL